MIRAGGALSLFASQMKGADSSQTTLLAVEAFALPKWVTGNPRSGCSHKGGLIGRVRCYIDYTCRHSLTYNFN
jgi:hypothetical protein